MTQEQEPYHSTQSGNPQHAAQSGQGMPPTGVQPQAPGAPQQPGGYQSQPGSYQPQPTTYTAPAQPKDTSSLVLGILSIVFMGPIGLILGIIGVVKTGKAPKPYTGKTKAGRICSIIGIVLGALLLIVALGMGGGSTSTSATSSATSASSSVATVSSESSSQATASSSSSDSTMTSSAASSSSAQSSSAAASSVSTEYKNALAKAESYAKTMHMSKQAVYDQLTSEYGEKFPADAAQYAIDNLNDVDWNANALTKAREYQKNMQMSTSAIYDQLTSEYGEKFTPEEAQYAIDNL